MMTVDNATMTQFEQHTSAVYGWAYRILGRHHDALDVVQDVFIRWTRQCGDQPPTKPRGWLRRVTVNRAIDVRRQRRTEPTPTKESPLSSTVAECSAETVDQTTLRDDIAIALDRLSDMQRSVLIAKVYDGLTFVRIAEELELAVPTIKTHYLRAVRSLRDRLQSRWA